MDAHTGLQANLNNKESPTNVALVITVFLFSEFSEKLLSDVKRTVSKILLILGFFKNSEQPKKVICLDIYSTFNFVWAKS